MKVYNDLTFIGGRIRGLSSAINNDEPVIKADSGGSSNKRVQSISSASGVVSCNWALYDEIRITTIAPITLEFTGANNGQGCILTLKGGNSVTMPTNVRYNSQYTSYLPTAEPLAKDKLGFSYDGDDSKYDFVSAILDIE